MYSQARNEPVCYLATSVVQRSAGRRNKQLPHYDLGFFRVTIAAAIRLEFHGDFVHLSVGLVFVKVT